MVQKFNTYFLNGPLAAYNINHNHIKGFPLYFKKNLIISIITIMLFKLAPVPILGPYFTSPVFLRLG
jgi:hypothetical protein